MLGAFDLYTVLVDQVFGGLLLTIVALAVLYVIVMVLGRLNGLTILTVVVYFIMICSLFYSALTFFFVFIGIVIYFIFGMIRFFSGGLN